VKPGYGKELSLPGLPVFGIACKRVSHSSKGG
jgi:hypothetical protein